MSTRTARLQRLFTHNWQVKLLALLTAAVTFYAIRLVTRYEIDHDVPIEVRVDGEGIAILELEPAVARVAFRGSQEDLLRIDKGRLRIVVHVSADVPVGSRRVAMRPRDLEGASGVSILSIDPASVRVAFDREVEKTVPVARPATTGTPLVGTVELDVEPAQVKVRGPRRALDDVVVARTEAIDVEGQGAAFTRRARVLLPGVAGVAQIDPPEVRVRVNFVTEEATRAWTNVAVRAMVRQDLPCRLEFAPPAVSVFASGRAEVLAAIPDGAVRVFVDCMDATASGTRVVPVHVHLPPGIEVNATVEPQDVTVVIGEREAAPGGGGGR